mmetsp:Transcript_13479/g.37264  ORF Transcript_13479/g.37264 Transcript_13479/m.37264 type:complete len:95 (+) Transcript_13479:393-677(+)
MSDYFWLIKHLFPTKIRAMAQKSFDTNFLPSTKRHLHRRTPIHTLSPTCKFELLIFHIHKVSVDYCPVFERRRAPSKWRENNSVRIEKGGDKTE